MRTLIASLVLFSPAFAQDNAWKDAPKGTVKGTLAFSNPRPGPRQPVVVYLERADAPTFAPPADPLTIRQKDAKFDPSFAVIVVGQKVVFDNNESQNIDHNVYTLGADETDYGIFGAGKKVTAVFAKPGEVRLYCSVHKFMDGKIFVAPTPAFAVVEGESDAFTIDGVPAGAWTLRTYQRAKRFHDAELKVDVAAGKAATVTVEMKR